jgi:hypothetical protein
VPPQNEREWEIAHKFFDEHTLQMMGEWKPEDGWLTWMSGKGLPWDPDEDGRLVQSNAGDVFQPLVRRDAGAGEADVA